MKRWSTMGWGVGLFCVTHAWAQSSCDFSPLLSGYTPQSSPSAGSPGQAEAKRFLQDYHSGSVQLDEFYGNASVDSGEWDTRGTAYSYIRAPDRQWLVKSPFRNVQYLYEFSRCGLRSVSRRSYEKGPDAEDYRVTPEFCRLLSSGSILQPRGGGTFADVEHYRRTGEGYDFVKKLLSRVQQSGAILPYHRVSQLETPQDYDFGFSRMKKFCSEVQMYFNRWSVPVAAEIQPERHQAETSPGVCATCSVPRVEEPAVAKPIREMVQITEKTAPKVPRTPVSPSKPKQSALVAEKSPKSAPPTPPKPVAVPPPQPPKDPRISAHQALLNYRKTGQCPTSSSDLLAQKATLEKWVGQFKNVPQNLEPIQGDYDHRFQFCGYNFSQKKWDSSLAFRIDWRGKLLQTRGGIKDCLEYQRSEHSWEKNVYVVRQGCRGERSHRDGGDYGDLVLVQVEPGVYVGLFYNDRDLIGAGYLFTGR